MALFLSFQTDKTMGLKRKLGKLDNMYLFHLLLCTQQIIWANYSFTMNPEDMLRPVGPETMAQLVFMFQRNS